MTPPSSSPSGTAAVRRPRLSAPSAAAARLERGGMREVARLAYPVVLAQMSITAMQFVDSAMVGTLGAAPLAAVGLGGVWLWTLISAFIGTATAVQTFVAQRFGAGRDAECGQAAWQGVHAVVPVAALASALLFFGSGQWLALLGTSPELRSLAGDYMAMRGLGAVPLAAATALASFFRGLGDTRTPLVATVIANLVNAALDYALIFGAFGMPALGVRGAGLATAIAEWVFLLALWLFFRDAALRKRHRTEPVRPRWPAIRSLLVTGLPIGGQWALEMVSFAAFLTLVARLGDAAMAASQAFIVLLSLSFMQAVGLSSAVTTLVGNYVGARDLEAAERSYRSGMRLAAALALGIAAVFVSIPGVLVGAFSRDPDVLRLGAQLMWVGAIYQVFDAFAIVADGALRGAGDTRWPFAVRFALSWGLFLPLGWGLGIAAGLGLAWAWVGGVVYVAVTAAALALRFRSGAWRHIEL